MSRRKGYFSNGVFSGMKPVDDVDEMWWELDLLHEQNVPCFHEPTHNEREAGYGITGD